MKIKLIVSLLFVLAVSSACKVLKSLKELKKEEASVYHYTLNDREIAFMPMHHLGKQEFYDDIKQTVADYKKQGYVVYYELIGTHFTKDSTLLDEVRRKARKIKGMGGSFKSEMSSSMFEKYVQQPAYKDLGIEETDVWADVDYLQLVNRFESGYRPIILDSTDLHTPFDAPYQREAYFTKDEYQAIIIDYRNDYLIQKIVAGNDKKVLVLYGEGHRKNFRKKLNALNKQK